MLPVPIEETRNSWNLVADCWKPTSLWLMPHTFTVQPQYFPRKLECVISVVLSRNKQNAKVLAHWGYRCFLGSLRKDGSTVRRLHIRLLERIWSKGTCNSVSITSPLPVITGPLRKRHSLILPASLSKTADDRRPTSTLTSLRPHVEAVRACSTCTLPSGPHPAGQHSPHVISLTLTWWGPGHCPQVARDAPLQLGVRVQSTAVVSSTAITGCLLCQTPWSVHVLTSAAFACWESLLYHCHLHSMLVWTQHYQECI